MKTNDNAAADIYVASTTMNAEVISAIPCSSQRRADLSKWFRISAGVILGLTGAAKLWSAFGSAGVLHIPEPFVGIPFNYLMFGAGAVEVAIAGVCFFGRRQTLSLGLIAWMATMLALYRFDLWWMDWRIPCSCLGTFTESLHLSPQMADNIMKIILGYLLIGSYALLFQQWRARKGTAQIAPAEPSQTTESGTKRGGERP